MPKLWKQMGIAAGAALAMLVALTPTFAQGANKVEVEYGTFLDPTNPNDPRAAAQNKMIEEFERRNPNISIKIFLDPSLNNTTRALRSGQATPDVFRSQDYTAPEFIATGNTQPLDDLIKRDNIDTKDYLIPLENSRIHGKIYGLFQDYRIPILIYRKSKLSEAGVTPPRTFAEVCKAGAKLSKGPVIGYAAGLGASGSLGGAQSFVESMLSTLLAGDNGEYFKEDNRTMGFTKDALVKAATLVKDLYVRCKATPLTGLNYSYTETHDGLRAGTVAMATFGLNRFRTIQKQGAGDDLGWAPPPGYTADAKQVVYGFELMLNANSKVKPQAWELIKFMGSPDAQAIAATGGEVVARASVYKLPYFSTAEGKDQLQWSEFVKSHGRVVNYSIIGVQFYQIIGDAFQAMVLKNTTPEQAANEVITKYTEAIGKVK
jgi:multiple sugar transport system substrate-binding protein